MGQIRDILLPLHLLLDVGRIVANLQFYGIYQELKKGEEGF